jgi:hypothetical protein
VKSTAGGRVAFTWKKVKTKHAKCEIQASTTSDFAETKSVPSPSGAKGSYVADGLRSGTTYYFRIRTVLKVSGKTYYSDWVKKKARIK